MTLVVVAASVEAEVIVDLTEYVAPSAGAAKIGYNFAPDEAETIGLAAATAVAALAVGAAAGVTGAAEGE